MIIEVTFSARLVAGLDTRTEESLSKGDREFIQVLRQDLTLDYLD